VEVKVKGERAEETISSWWCVKRAPNPSRFSYWTWFAQAHTSASRASFRGEIAAGQDGQWEWSENRRGGKSFIRLIVRDVADCELYHWQGRYTDNIISKCNTRQTVSEMEQKDDKLEVEGGNTIYGVVASKQYNVTVEPTAGFKIKRKQR